MFADNVCASPCPRFLAGKPNENGMIPCLFCDMWFIDEDPTVDDTDPAVGTP